MSRGPRPNSTTGRIRALLPATYDAIYAAIPDVPQEVIRRCIGAMVGHGRVKRSKAGLLSPVTITVRSILVPSDERETEAARSPVWGGDPAQSPRVTCPATVTVSLSTCLDDYATAASGHRSARPECTRCAIGARRRDELARGAA